MGENRLIIVREVRAVDPEHIPLPLEPGELALCEVAGVPLQNPHGFLERQVAVQVVEDFLVAEALHGDHVPRAAGCL